MASTSNHSRENLSVTSPITRRDWLTHTPLALGAALSAGTVGSRAQAAQEPSDPVASPFGFCFNTSTIMGQKVPVPDQVDIVAEAGYDAIEPWIRDLDRYVEGGLARRPGQADPGSRPGRSQRHRLFRLDRR